MRRILTALLSVVVVCAFLTACNAAPQKEKEEATEAVAQPTSQISSVANETLPTDADRGSETPPQDEADQTQAKDPELQMTINDTPVTVEWEDNESWWRGLIWGRSVLRGTSKVVAGDRYELRLYVPAGWRVWGWSPNPERTQEVSAEGPFVRLSFTPEKTGVIRWHVAFERD